MGAPLRGNAAYSIVEASGVYDVSGTVQVSQVRVCERLGIREQQPRIGTLAADQNSSG